MKKLIFISALALCMGLTACGNSESSSTSTESAATTVTETATTAEETTEAETTTAPETTAEETTEQVTAPQQEVGFEGMEAIYGDSLNDGEYHISVDSSSSMFKIADCILKVSGGEMTADIIIASKSYDNLFMGTGDEAEADGGENYIDYTVNEDDQSVFNVPVEALDKEISCAALSAKKQEWYDRTLVFRADSLPDEAFSESRYTTLDTLDLADGEYNIDVTLEGGSGKATVASPARLTVSGGTATAEIIWSSDKYDYMIVDGEKYLPDIVDGHSVFNIPVSGFDCKMPVSADTTAMSQPYEIEYKLFFDSSTIAE